MECIEAWLYERYSAKERQPRHGFVVTDAESCASDPNGYFVEDGATVKHGFTVPGRDGVARDHVVWFKQPVSEEIVREAIRAWADYKAAAAERDRIYFKRLAKEFGAETQEDDA